MRKALTNPSLNIGAAVCSLLILGVAAALMVGFLLLTPTLNFDDLIYADYVPLTIEQQPGSLQRMLVAALLNADIGVREIRTYGLSRAIQILTTAAFGRDPLPTYIFISVIHLASGLIIFKIFKEISGDALTAVFAAFLWVASPAVLPFLKVQHHFLYLIAPFYSLLLWALLSSIKRLPLIPGAALLTLSWMLGEAAIIPMGIAVALTAWFRKDPKIITQGAVAVILLAAYLGYQKLFVSDPSYAQRFVFHFPALNLLPTTVLQLLENGKALLGLGYYDAEFTSRMGNINPYDSPIAVFIAVGLFGVAHIASVGTPLRTERKNYELLAVFVAIWLCSPALYIAFSLMGTQVLAVRYTVGFFALMPLAALAILVKLSSPKILRIASAAAVALSFAVSISILYKEEEYINKPNRAFFSGLQPDTAIVAHHVGWRNDAKGNMSGDYPGLIPAVQTGVANPLRQAWTTFRALRLYSGVTFGTACRILSDTHVAIYFEGTESQAEKSKVQITGFPDRESFVLQSYAIEDVCAKDNTSEP